MRNIAVKIIIVLLSAITCLFFSAKNARACAFTVTTATLSFGNLNPGSPVDVNVSTTLTFKCAGGPPGTTWTYAITDDDGLYETGINANRMRNTTVTTEYLPYTFTYAPATGTLDKNVPETLTINGTVKGIDYQNAYVGSYSDTVILTITP